MQKFIKESTGFSKNGVLISMPDESDPCTFRFHLLKGSGVSEKGMDGYIEMLGVRDAITETIAYMYKEHHDFVIKAFTEYNQGLCLGVKSPSNLFQNIDPNDSNASVTIEARNASIHGESDSIRITHSSPINNEGDTVADPERAISNLTISINKLEGDLENGLQGFIRLNALRSAIERACCTLNLAFKDIHKNAEAVAGINSSKRKEGSSLTM